MYAWGHTCGPLAARASRLCAAAPRASRSQCATESSQPRARTLQARPAHRVLVDRQRARATGRDWMGEWGKQWAIERARELKRWAGWYVPLTRWRWVVSATDSVSLMVNLSRCQSLGTEGCFLTFWAALLRLPGFTLGVEGPGACEPGLYSDAPRRARSAWHAPGALELLPLAAAVKWCGPRSTRLRAPLGPHCTRQACPKHSASETAAGSLAVLPLLAPVEAEVGGRAIIRGRPEPFCDPKRLGEMAEQWGASPRSATALRARAAAGTGVQGRRPRPPAAIHAFQDCNSVPRPSPPPPPPSPPPQTDSCTLSTSGRRQRR